MTFLCPRSGEPSVVPPRRFLVKTQSTSVGKYGDSDSVDPEILMSELWLDCEPLAPPGDAVVPQIMIWRLSSSEGHRS